MSFQLSPGVEYREIDHTNTIQAVSTSTGGYAGHFNWGPVDKLIGVSSEKDLASYFGPPVDNKNARSFLTAASFLKYSNSLRVSRAIDAVLAKNAADASPMLIKNEDYFDNATKLFHFSARYPGLLGNSLSVEVATEVFEELTPVASTYSSWAYRSLFNSAPGKSLTAEAASLLFNDEIHVVVVDVDGEFSGVKGTILEKFEGLSLIANAKDEDGTSLYYLDVINNSSKYIYANVLGDIYLGADLNVNDTADIYLAADADQIRSFALTGGVDGTVDSGHVATALEMFADKETADINLLFAESLDTDQDVINTALYEVANTRRDILASIAAPISVATLNTAADKKAAVELQFDAIASSSFVMFSQTPVYTYNKYSDRYVWIPECGHMCGLCANTDKVADPWFSPAGLNRGQLRGITKIAYSPNKFDRDDLYKKRINSIITIPGEGIVLYGDKTAQSKSGAFDRINVRRLFNVLTRSISNAARYQLFEFNDEFTRAAFRNVTEPFLRDVQGRRGIIAFRVVCDASNNPGEVIDRNEFVGDIFIKPAKSINFIRLNFIATRSSVEFAEIAG